MRSTTSSTTRASACWPVGPAALRPRPRRARRSWPTSPSTRPRPVSVGTAHLHHHLLPPDANRHPARGLLRPRRAVDLAPGEPQRPLGRSGDLRGRRRTSPSSPATATRRSPWSGPRTRRDFPIPTGDHRFGFEIVTSGTSAAALQAAGGIGHVDLDWFPSTLPDVAGYNLYRADASGGPYTKLNGALVVDTDYVDWTAEPGVEYWYVYRVVNTEVEEGPDSDEASAAALDDVPPVIEHTPVTSAPAGLPITIVATVTDNVATPTAKLYPPRARLVGPVGPGGDGQRHRQPVHRQHSGRATRWRRGGSTTSRPRTASPPCSTALRPRRTRSPSSTGPRSAGVTPIHGPLGGRHGGDHHRHQLPGRLHGDLRRRRGHRRGAGRQPDPHLHRPGPLPGGGGRGGDQPQHRGGTKTRAYTYDGTATIVRLPTTAHDRMSDRRPSASRRPESRG